MRALFLGLCLSLTACDICDILPPLPSGQCGTFLNITAVAATDAGTAQVTVGCNQGTASACDGGTPAPCPTSTCIEVDWVAVASGFNGNCSQASPEGLTAAAACTPLVGDAGVTLLFTAPVSAPTPQIVFARFGDGGASGGCDMACAQSAATCVCNAALQGVSDQTCAALK